MAETLEPKSSDAAGEAAKNGSDDLTEQTLRHETGEVDLVQPWPWIFSGIALVWSLFQLWIASPLPFILNFGYIGDVQARGLHLAFAMVLCYIAFGPFTEKGVRRPGWYDIVCAIAAAIVCSYLWWGYQGIAQRAGILLNHTVMGVTIPTEVIMGGIGIVLLLEATRRAIGLPLVIMGLLFLAYSMFGQSMPDIISHRGMSFSRLVGYQWLTGEGIFGIPIDVSTRFVFLFVLFGAVLNRAGAGQYFIDLSYAMVGRYRGGPAKASVLASGMTGMISGSSIANVVTTGTFTIPVMKRIGMPATKAGAVEVAASTDGQIMPPIMGAAAFVMAEFIGISYFDVVVHAFIPAVMSYVALFYITHLEALKLNILPLPASETPRVRDVFWRGAHYLLPIVLLIYLLMVERRTTESSVFWSILFLMAIIIVQEAWRALRDGGSLMGGLSYGCRVVVDGMISGGKNMIAVAIAVASAGIIVGAVASTGLNNALIGVVEAIAGSNIYLLLVLTAVLCLILGMGLPTTANYLVVASIMAPVLSDLGTAAGLVLPIIAVHLFVFYFGLMADVTPPVGLAAYAAAAISRADPIQTGIQAFYYSIRTAILPFIFIFNLNLILVDLAPGWEGIIYAAMIFVVAIIGSLCFTSLTFRWMMVRLSWLEMALLVVVCVGLLRPGFIMDRIYPPFRDVSAEALAQGIEEPAVRLHVLRHTDYGDRRKLYTFQKPAGKPLSWEGLGMTVEPSGEGQVEVVDPGFMSVAEKAGMEPGDIVTQVDTKVPGQPAKEWLFIPSLLILAYVLWAQRRRRGQAVGRQPAAKPA